GLHHRRVPGHHADPGADAHLRAEDGHRLRHPGHGGPVDWPPAGALHLPRLRPVPRDHPMNASDVFGKLVEQANLSLIIFTVGLMMCRILPVLIFSPFLGGEVIPVEVKMGIGVTLSIVMFPTVAGRMGAIPITPLPFIALLCKELFLGMTL